MRSMKKSLRVGLVAVAGLVFSNGIACSDVTLKEGFPCSAAGTCPSPYICTQMGCYLHPDGGLEGGLGGTAGGAGNRGIGGSGLAGKGGGAGGAAGSAGAAGYDGGGGSGLGAGGNAGHGGAGGSAGAGGSGAGGSAGAGGGGAGGSGGAGGGGAGGSAGAGGGGTGGSGGAGGAKTCPSTQHNCSGTCMDNSSTQSCGSSCTACATPTGGTATCDGTSCGSSCNTGYHNCSGTCSSNTSVATCGASCSPCPTTANGAYSCLSNGACSLACNTGYLQCLGGPRTCTANSWSFEDGSADGFGLVSQVGGSADGIAVSTAHAADGTQSLAIAATFNCTRTAFEVLVYPCTLGTPVNMSGLTLTFQVYVEGPALPAYGAQEASAVILDSSSSYVDLTPQVGAWVPVSVPLTDPSDASADGFGFSFYMVPSGPPPGNVCMQWQGTIYLDAFKVQ
jgi:hypothetical protein